MPKFAANLTMLFTEVPFLERFQKARQAGFDGVEFLFPYPYDKASLKHCLEANQLTQVLFNMPPGDWEKGERGIACHPERINEFKAGVDNAIDYAQALGCRQINCLAGLLPDCSEKRARETLLSNLEYAARKLESSGLTLMIEAINSKVDMPGFFLDTAEKVVGVISEVKNGNVKLQLDLYHQQIMNGDLIRTIDSLLPHIGHIQIADNPGRHEPGTGEINFATIFERLDMLGYDGWVSAEYIPRNATEDGLGWFYRSQQSGK